MPVVTAREMLVNWITEVENTAALYRSLSRQFKTEALALEERAVRMRSSLPPEEIAKEPPDGQI